jgi:hypothetical protein
LVGAQPLPGVWGVPTSLTKMNASAEGLRSAGWRPSIT